MEKQSISTAFQIPKKNNILVEIAGVYTELLADLYTKSNNNFELSRSVAIEAVFKTIFALKYMQSKSGSSKLKLNVLFQKTFRRDQILLSDLKLLWKGFSNAGCTSSLNKDWGRDEFGSKVQKLNLKINLKVLTKIEDQLTYIGEISSIDLGYLYEKMAFALTEKDLSSSVVNHMTIARRMLGTFFTPENIADFITKRTLEKFVVNAETKIPKVLDPAMGSGVFLILAYRFFVGKLMNDLEKRSVSTSKELLSRKIVKKLFGNDIDHLSVEVAKLSLLIETNFSNVSDILDENLTSSDALLNLELWKKIEPQVILMNPPYGRVKSPELRDKYHKSLSPYIKGEMNLYKLFFGLATEVQPARGRLGVICPSDFLRESASDDLRKCLLSEYQQEYMLDLPLNFFPGVSLEPFIGVMEKKTLQQDFFENKKVLWFSEKSRKNLTFEEINMSVTSKSMDVLVNPLNFSIGEVRQSKKSFNGWELKTLKDIFRINFGFHPGKGKGITNQKLSSEHRRLWEGRDIDCFQSSNEKKYLKLDNDSYSKYSDIKIVMQRVRTRKSGEGSKWLRAVLDTNGVVNMASTNGLYFKNKELDPYFLIAALNSNYVERELQAITTNVNLTAATLEQLTIPVPKNVNIYKEICRLGRKLSLIGTSTKGNTEIKMQVEELMKKIDEVFP